MRKCILLAALLLVSQLNYIQAQGLFDLPDTVCKRQPVTITSNVSNASSFYWGFCSGYVDNPPIGSNLGSAFSFVTPGAVEIAKDGGNYYGFVANIGTNELLRLNYGSSLSNLPTVSNFGTLNTTVPDATTKLFLTKDAAGNWFMFACGGSTQGTSTIARFDFGASLANTPNSVNFGNLNNVLNGPRGIFVIAEGANWYGYVVNSLDNALIRLSFGTNISNTPLAASLGTGFGLSGASDMVAVQNNGNWFSFVTNQASNTLSRLDFGPSLNSLPGATNIGSLAGKVQGPTALTYVTDCGSSHVFLTNATTNELLRVDMPDITGPYSGVVFPGLGGFSGPTGISHVIRDRDNLYSYVVNGFDNSLSQIVFPQCTNSSVISSERPVPLPYSYDTPGTYNVYLAIDEGLPTAQVECKQIEVLDIPQITLNNDTLICQGDTIGLFVQAFGALSITWKPYYNISDTVGMAIKVWPEFSTDYHVVLPYSNGCIVDTPVKVTVSKNKADAGPDRTISDGAKTLLGGPFTSQGPQYTYTWLPSQFLTSTIITNPVASPPFDFTYYLEVRNTQGCYDIDTVVIRVECDDLNLPNAFVPESRNTASNKFGVLNKQIIKLNYLRVYDRWGKAVFTTTDVAEGWDGKVDGEPAPYGVYVWEADGFCIEGKRFKRSGNVTLIR
jgi:gliding motility-associated-like protein